MNTVLMGIAAFILAAPLAAQEPASAKARAMSLPRAVVGTRPMGTGAQALKGRIPSSFRSVLPAARVPVQAVQSGAAGPVFRSQGLASPQPRRRLSRRIAELKAFFRGPERRFDPDTRIGIVGAGPSGLMAAEELKKKGYRNVVLLERNEEAGGKAHTIRHRGLDYEMGAVLATPTYSAVHRIAKEVGVRPRRPSGALSYYSLATGRPTSYLTLGERLRLPFEMAKYAWLYLTRWRGLLKPGLADAPRELAANFHEVLAAHGLRVAEKMALGPSTAFGYGWPEEVPAAYWLKYLHPLEPLLMFQWHEFEGGYQEIFRRLAARHDVRYGTDIKAIERGRTVKVRTAAGKLEFDRLIITSPLREALNFLDASAEERDLFGRIETYDYRTYLCEVENLPPTPGLGAYLPENFGADKAGHPMVWYHRHKATNAAVFYVLARPAQSDAEIEQNIAEDMAKLGARLKTVAVRRRWRYFPHVTTETMAGGFHERVRRLQGTRNTYYAGEVMSFSTVKLASDWAIELARELF